MYKIEIYQDDDGISEIKEYIKNLRKKSDKDSKIKFKKIVTYLDLLSQRGITIGEPYVKHLEDEIWELRPIRDRILFAYMENNKIVLLSIFLKQTQKTPIREIEKAKRFLRKYKKRSDANE